MTDFVIEIVNEMLVTECMTNHIRDPEVHWSVGFSQGDYARVADGRLEFSKWLDAQKDLPPECLPMQIEARHNNWTLPITRNHRLGSTVDIGDADLWIGGPYEVFEGLDYEVWRDMVMEGVDAIEPILAEWIKDLNTSLYVMARNEVEYQMENEDADI